MTMHNSTDTSTTAQRAVASGPLVRPIVFDPSFLVCPYLIVRTDHGHATAADYKNVSKCECRAQQEGKPCCRRGVCIEARHPAAWTRINSSSWPNIRHEPRPTE